MNKESIDKLLSQDYSEALDAHKEIVSIQKNKDVLIKLGDSWVDNSLVGGLNNKAIFFGSRPSNGKTYHCSQTINNLLNKELNPAPIRVLRLNLEMPTTSLLIREISKVLGKKPSEVLQKQYTEEEQPIVRQIVGSFNDKRVTNISRTLKGQDFRYLIEKYLEGIDKEDDSINAPKLNALCEGKNEDEKKVIKEQFVPHKTKKVVVVDHLHIYPDKTTIDEILLICNDLRLSDRNLSFIFYFQLSRTIEDMWRETKDKKPNPRNMLPNSTFIYLTDVLQQLADLVVGMVIPQIYDLETFASVHRERDAHLKEHFVDDGGDSDWVKLKGRNRIYYNIFKNRMTDDFEDPRLFCSILNPKYEEKANKIMKENLNPFGKTNALPVFSTPVVEQSTTAEIIPTSYADLSSVFDSQVVKSKSDDPF